MQFSNALFDEIKWGAILASKAMLLASHGENFGVSLAESLCVGKPVLTTYKVNIARDILKYNAGLISKDTISKFSKILTKFDRLNKKELTKMSNNALNCFKNNFDFFFFLDTHHKAKKDLPNELLRYGDTHHIQSVRKLRSCDPGS